MLATIGYEGADLEDFLETLRRAQIEVLVDVRDRAQSRRKGFSKTALSQALNGAGIQYLHYPELGDPKPGRDAARSGDWDTFRRIYRAVIKSDDAQKAIEAIKGVLEKNSACLLCYERDPATCHRAIVADNIRNQLEIEVRHLGVRKFDQAA